MSNSIFQQEQPTQEVPATNSVDALATKLFDIKNENGEPKYDSLEKALGALSASQQYIPQLKDENEQLKARLAALQADLSKRETVEETLARFSTSRQPQDTPTSEAPKGLDEAAVQAMLQRTLTERESQALSTQNVNAVSSALESKYGDKAKEIVASKAKELGMTLQQVQSLAASSPQAVLAWFSASAPTTTGAPVRSTVNIPPVAPKEGIQPPTKSLMRGASGKDLTEYMAQIRKEVYRQNDIQE